MPAQRSGKSTVKDFREAIALIFLLLLGVFPRYAFVTKFPSIPFSDFLSLVAFGQYLHEHGILSNGWFWEFFNPGLPLILCGLFTIFPGANPETTARISTMVVTGLVPVLPFLIWRGVLPFWVRLLAGSALALWPGQILFSGVVAQDNWVMPPVIALGALAVRALYSNQRSTRQSLAAGLLYAISVALRQEMAVALLPLLLAAGGLMPRFRKQQVLAVCLAAGMPLLASAIYRGAATGRFSLTTEHGGLSILGAYVPGAMQNGWIDPYPFIASVRPDLLSSPKAVRSHAALLAFREVVRRPVFQIARILSTALIAAVWGESYSLTWSLDAPEVLPASLHEQATALSIALHRPLRIEMAAMQGLFVSAIVIAIRLRKRAILFLAATVVLKYILHAVTNMQGRYFFVATGLEILAIVLAIYEVAPALRPKIGLLAGALTAGLATSAVLIFFAPWFAAFMHGHDIDPQRTYQFPLMLGQSALLSCRVDQGVLDALNVAADSRHFATIRTFHTDPPPDETAVAACELTGTGEPLPVILQVFDSYAPGGMGDRMVQSVALDGGEVWTHDIGREAGTGWANIPLGNVGAATKRQVVIAVKAVRPDPGADWGDAARTTFRLARP